MEDTAAMAAGPAIGGMSAPAASAAKMLELPEHEFTYLAGSTDRPWNQFTGRWLALQPHLAEMLAACGDERPLRVVDVGSCTGFFALQVAHRHPEADVVGVEGSVGVGNGTVGMAGTARQILRTHAVQTHLRWIRRLGLPNCFVAPEVWDYTRVCELASSGNSPICDVLLLLSILHHIDSVSVQQYASAGLSRLDGIVSLISKVLCLAPRHFVELPNRPFLAAAYDAFQTQRGILEAAAKASGHQWRFRGPIYTAEWFGVRELWLMEVADQMAPLDVHVCPFPLLHRGEEGELAGDNSFDDMDSQGLGAPAYRAAANLPHGALDPHLMDPGFSAGLMDPALDAAVLPPLGGHLADTTLGGAAACQNVGSMLIDPGMTAMAAPPCGPVEEGIAEAVSAAPTALLVAHLTLREAMNEALDVLNEVRKSGLVDDNAARRIAQNAAHSQQDIGSMMPQAPPRPAAPPQMAPQIRA